MDAQMRLRAASLEASFAKLMTLFEVKDVSELLPRLTQLRQGSPLHSKAQLEAMLAEAQRRRAELQSSHDELHEQVTLLKTTGEGGGSGGALIFGEDGELVGAFGPPEVEEMARRCVQSANELRDLAQEDHAHQMLMAKITTGVSYLLSKTSIIEEGPSRPMSSKPPFAGAGAPAATDTVREARGEKGGKEDGTRENNLTSANAPGALWTVLQRLVQAMLVLQARHTHAAAQSRHHAPARPCHLFAATSRQCRGAITGPGVRFSSHATPHPRRIHAASTPHPHRIHTAFTPPSRPMIRRR